MPPSRKILSLRWMARSIASLRSVASHVRDNGALARQERYKRNPMAAEPKSKAPAEMDDLRSFILNLDDSESELVTVPGWQGVQLLVKALTAAQRADFLKHCSTQ